LGETETAAITPLADQKKINALLLALKRLLSTCDAELTEGKLSQKSYARGLARAVILAVEKEQPDEIPNLR
jgi:hypothetical protein